MAPKRDSYWRLVRKRATTEARAALSIETGERIVFGVVLTIAAIALLWMWGSEGATKDAAIERVGPWVIAILAVFPVVWVWKFIRTIPVMHTEQSSKIGDLERQLLPQLDFAWSLSHVQEVETGGSPVEIEGKVGLITVRNGSELARADSVEVELVSYRRIEWEQPITLNLRVFSDSMREMLVNINPGRAERFALFKCKYGADRIRLGPFSNPRRVNVSPGKYEIRIVASASVGRPVEERCFLGFSEYADIEFRPWGDGDGELGQPHTLAPHRP